MRYNDNNINLFHGSNTVVNPIILNRGKSKTDFGKGFYLTKSRKQAEKMALRKKYSKKEAEAVVNQYNFDYERAEKFANIVTLKPDMTWLNILFDNRFGTHKVNLSADIIIGPTADGKLYKTLLSWKNGKINQDEALLQLKPDLYTTQYCFKTERGISFLTFLDSTVL